MDFDQIIFGKKKFSDVLKNIYDNSKNKESQIKALIEQLKPLIGNNTQSALVIVPLIAEYLKIGINNDEQLVKMASIVQRAMSSSNRSEGDDYFPDMEELREELQKVADDVNDPIEKKDIVEKEDEQSKI